MMPHHTLFQIWRSASSEKQLRGRQRLAHRLDDVGDILVSELWRQWQTYSSLPDGKTRRIVFRPPPIPVLIIRMDRNALIVNTHADVLFDHSGKELVPRYFRIRIDKNGVEVIGVPSVLFD